VKTRIGPLPNGIRFTALYPPGLTAHGSSQAGGGSRYAYTWDCGSLRFEMVEDALRVNGRDYGTLRAGDAVVIDGRGDLSVTVNGVERAPGRRGG
jgi:hypothetical protein